MFEIKQEANFDRKEKLLYNIWQELKKANEPIDYAIEPIVSKKEEVETDKEEFKCEDCEKVFKSKNALISHSRVHKKESDSSGKRSGISKGKKGSTT